MKKLTLALLSVTVFNIHAVASHSHHHGHRHSHHHHHHGHGHRHSHHHHHHAHLHAHYHSYSSCGCDHNFNGIFIGAQIGGSHHHSSAQINLTHNNANYGPFSKKMNSTGFIVGILGGYNLRLNNFVVGLEAHVQKDFMKAEERISHPQLPQDFRFKYDQIYNLGVAAKAGWVATKDLLLFAKAGVEFHRYKYTGLFSYTNHSFKENVHPFVVGLGAEKMVRNIGLRLSYDYTFKNDTFKTNAGSSSFSASMKKPNHKILLGAVWHF